MPLAAATRPCSHIAHQAGRYHAVIIQRSSRALKRVAAVDRPGGIPGSPIPQKTEKKPFQHLQQNNNSRRYELSSNHIGGRHVGWRGGQKPPKGVNTTGFEKRLVTPPDNPELPRMDALIIVEGFNDCVAIHRAVRAPVYVLCGGYALAEEMKPELRYVAGLAAAGQLPPQVVVFTDPDWQGRTFRTYLDDLLPQPAAASMHQPPVAAAPSSNLRLGKGLVVRHAFLRVEQGTSEVASRYHEAGNVGVEHASPDTIRACLVRARRGFGTTRTEFSVEQLRADGLIGSWNDKNQVVGPQLRRGRFCRALGIDEVGTGKGLVNLLNRFFTREEYEAALKVATSQNS